MNSPPRSKDGRYFCSACGHQIGIAWDDKPEGSYLQWACRNCGNGGRELFAYEEFSGVIDLPADGGLN